MASRDRFRGESTFARHQLLGHLRRISRRDQVDFSVTPLAEIATPAVSRLGRARQVEQLRAALAELPVDDQLLLERRWQSCAAARR